MTHRSACLSPTGDWSSVWPVARSFAPSVVPLPIRMGFQKQYWTRPPPAKFANLELVKIPNFLHLTPATIRKHCQALRGGLLS